MALASPDAAHEPWLAGSVAGNVGSADDVYAWMQNAVVDGLYEDLMLSHVLLCHLGSLSYIFFSCSLGPYLFSLLLV